MEIFYLHRCWVDFIAFPIDRYIGREKVWESIVKYF